MKIVKIINKVQNKIAANKIATHQKAINRFVNTEGMDAASDAFNQVEIAKETIANFAKKHCVSVDIFDTSKSIYSNDEVQQNLKQSLKGNLSVRVANILNGRSKEAIISSDVNKSYIHSKANPMLITDPESGTDHISTSHLCSEDNFLRYLYRHIAKLTSEVTSKK